MVIWMIVVEERPVCLRKHCNTFHVRSGFSLAGYQSSLSRRIRINHRPSTTTVIYYVKSKAEITILAEIKAAVEATASWTKETRAPLGGVVNCAGVRTAAKVSPPHKHTIIR